MAEAWTLRDNALATTQTPVGTLTQKGGPYAADLMWVFTRLGLNSRYATAKHTIGPVDEYTAEEAKSAAQAIYLLTR